ncbi:class I SAM-dependent methyltransferase [soil metagenome]
MEPSDPKQVVEHGYDQIGAAYGHWSSKATDQARERYTKLLLNELPKRSRVLDLGCGSGELLTRHLSHRFEVTGVELSRHMVELARRNVPEANFIHADMSSVSFPPGSFDGVCAFYSLTHLPREELPTLLRSITSWLKPGGILVTSLGSDDNPGSVETNWINGIPMYFAGYPVEKNIEIVEESGLKVMDARLETIHEKDGPVAFLWIVARKPRQST